MIKRNKIRKTQKVIFNLQIFFFICIVALLYLVFFFPPVEEFSQTQNTQQSLSPLGPDCNNLSFQDTAICLNDFARENFVYNLTDDSWSLTVEDMIKRGGDCKDWTDFYDKYMSYYGYTDNQKVRVFVDTEIEDDDEVYVYHIFLIASHSSGYCLMDIEDLECFVYVNEEGEIRE